MTSKTLENTMNFVDNSFVIADKCGVVQFANNQVTRKTGYSLAEIVGRKPGDLWGGNMETKFYKRMWNKIKYEKEPFFAEMINESKSGEEYIEDMFFAPVMDDYGSVEYYIEISSEEDDADFKKNFLEIFSDQQKQQRKLPEFLLKQLDTNQENKKQKDADSISGFLFDVFIKPVKEKFKNRRKDKQLIKQAQEDPQQFQLLYDKYKADINNYFKYRLNSLEKANDLTQEVFVKAFKYLDDFKIKNASYKTYLMRIAHNLLVNYYRKTEKKSQARLDDIPDSILSCLDGYDDILIKERLQYAMKNCLTESQYRIMKMKYFDQLLVREIATVIQKSENAVKLHLHRGRKKLKEYLKDK